MPVITVDKNCCKGCNICYSICPKKLFVPAKIRNSYGTNLPEAVNQQDCILCGMCERLCPDGAINVTKTENVKTEGDENHED